jgi:hypothetical protein
MILHISAYITLSSLSLPLSSCDLKVRKAISSDAKAIAFLVSEYLDKPKKLGWWYSPIRYLNRLNNEVLVKYRIENMVPKGNHALFVMCKSVESNGSTSNEVIATIEVGLTENPSSENKVFLKDQSVNSLEDSGKKASLIMLVDIHKHSFYIYILF